MKKKLKNCFLRNSNIFEHMLHTRVINLGQIPRLIFSVLKTNLAKMLKKQQTKSKPSASKLRRYGVALGSNGRPLRLSPYQKVTAIEMVECMEIPAREVNPRLFYLNELPIEILCGVASILSAKDVNNFVNTCKATRDLAEFTEVKFKLDTISQRKIKLLEDQNRKRQEVDKKRKEAAIERQKAEMAWAEREMRLYKERKHGGGPKIRRILNTFYEFKHGYPMPVYVVENEYGDEDEIWPYDPRYYKI
ncbi:putative orfan [Tupanvirus soda lake]|uniref:Orfan n=2 Tax=Tupanvirus TaxID=2094720 RepID=A0AC62ADD6_9VIRU|nr:putative orfan [Tupanvirus soda lake]QKU35727.1 putative orfan [Tupanvirus soda lake]